MKHYRLAPSGRRLTLSLIVGTILLWCSAIWLLQGALGIEYAALATSLRATLADGLDAARLIPAGVLLVIILSGPLLLWSLWQEWTTSYTLSDTGLTYRAASGTLQCSWKAIRGVEPQHESGTVGVVLVTPDVLGQIRNPVSRWLYRQAFGADRVPLYAGVEHPDELVQELGRRVAARTTEVSI